nr:malectin domain-containing carbohydrate-binding protein [Halocatena marina]
MYTVSRSPPYDQSSRTQDSDNWLQWALFGLGGVFLLGSIIVLVGVPGLPLGGLTDTNSTSLSPTDSVSPVPDPTETERQMPVPTATATSEPSDTTIYRINVGGPRLKATDNGPDWLADQENAPSTYLNHRVSDTVVNDTPDPITVENAVSATTPQSLFKTYRFSRKPKLWQKEMEWGFPADPNSVYEVRIYVVEPFFTSGQSGRPSEESYSEEGPRSFDVVIENKTALQNYEPFVEHGHDVGAVKSFETTVDDGSLTIRFHHRVENPVISGIEIIEKNPGNGNN